MESPDFYLYINNKNMLSAVGHTPLNTSGGADAFFESRGIRNFWGVNSYDPQSFLKAISEALEKDANHSSVYKFAENIEVTAKDVENWVGGAGLKLEEMGNGYRISDGINNAKGSSAITAFLNWYSLEDKIDTSNDPEEIEADNSEGSKDSNGEEE